MGQELDHELDRECVEEFARVLHQAARETWAERYDADALWQPTLDGEGSGNLLAPGWEELSDHGREHVRSFSARVARITGGSASSVTMLLAAVAAVGLT